MPEVDAIIGTNEIEQIVAVCEGIGARCAIRCEPYLYHDLTPRISRRRTISHTSKLPRAAIIPARFA